MCICVWIFPPDSLGHQGGGTFSAERWCWLPCAALGPAIRPVPPAAANGSSLTFPAEASPAALPHSCCVCLQGGTNVETLGASEMWKSLFGLVFFFFAGAAGLQPVAQRGLIVDTAVWPSSRRGTCGDVCWAHHCFTHP